MAFSRGAQIGLPIIWLLLTTVCRAGELPMITARQVAKTAAWFDSIEWPALRDAPYVELSLAASSDIPESQRMKIRAFLLAEDPETLTIFCDGTSVTQNGIPSMERGYSWQVQPLSKTPEQGNYRNVMLPYRKLALPEAVEAVLAARQHPRIPVNPNEAFSGDRRASCTSLFVFARCCARQGRNDLAHRLDDELTRPESALPADNTGKSASFQAAIEEELGRLRFSDVIDAYRDPMTPRASSVRDFEKFAHDFPLSPDSGAALKSAAWLKPMATEEAAHQNLDKPFESLSDPEKIANLIYCLRDQTGFQRMMPGEPDIFDSTRSDAHQDTPAHQLAAFGVAAVPALLKALDDRRLSRVYGGGPDTASTAPFWSVGDCAIMVLGRIAGRNFRQPEAADEEKLSKATSYADYTAATRRAILRWWDAVQKQGESAVLAAGVKSGRDDSLDQARLLAERDPVAAVEAIDAGLRAKGMSDWVQTQFMDIVAGIKTLPAQAVLRREMLAGPSLHVRVAAGTTLFEQGDKGVVAAMIEEWRRWQAVVKKDFFDDSNNPDPLVHFLGSCGDLAAMQSLADRFAPLPLDVKSTLLETVTGTAIAHPPVRGDDVSQPPEVAALGEEIAASALDDPAVHYGTSGSRFSMHEQSSWLDPRVCDFAADALAQAWPDRYTFAWAATRQERDEFIARDRNVWRIAHGQPALPVPEHPPVDPARSPNQITVCRWSGGDALPDFPLTEGRELTAAAGIDAILRLYRDLPANFEGFGLTMERAGNGRGFTVEIAWRPGPRPPHPRNWDFNVSISRGVQNLHNESGGQDLSGVKRASYHADERFALENALKAPPDQAVIIHYNSRLDTN